MKLIRCEAQIEALINNKRWKEVINKPIDYPVLSGADIYKYFLQDYSRTYGNIIENTEWNDCVVNISDHIAKGEPMILYGMTGVGKTSIMQTFGRILSILGNPNHLPFITKRATDLVDEFKKGADINQLYSKPITSGLKRNAGLFIDDIGAEELGVSYGAKSDVIGDLIQAIDARHDMKDRVSFSTNLNGDDIKERYGERVYSRLFQNRTVIVFPESIPDFRLRK